MTEVLNGDVRMRAYGANDEVGVRAAYDRSLQQRGTTNVGRAISAHTVPEAPRVLDTRALGKRWI